MSAMPPSSTHGFPTSTSMRCHDVRAPDPDPESGSRPASVMAQNGRPPSANRAPVLGMNLRHVASARRRMPGSARSPSLPTTADGTSEQPAGRAERRRQDQEVLVMDIVFLAITVVLAIVLPRGRALPAVAGVW